MVTHFLTRNVMRMNSMQNFKSKTWTKEICNVFFTVAETACKICHINLYNLMRFLFCINRIHFGTIHDYFAVKNTRRKIWKQTVVFFFWRSRKIIYCKDYWTELYLWILFFFSQWENGKNISWGAPSWGR